MKIYFRYLLLEMVKPLGFCLVAMMALLIVVDLFGSLEEFNEHNASWDVILKYYVALVPSLIPHMLPVSVLFATLYSLLTLSRRSEIIALQAGGMGPLKLFAPFIAMAGVCAVFLFVVMGWPATQSDATRSQIMEELRTGGKTQDVARNVIFVDPVFHHVWHIKALNEKTQQAKDIDVLLRTHDKKDRVKYVANEAVYTGDFWRLRNGRKFEFEEGQAVPKQQAFETLDVPELNTSALALAFVQSEPEELTLDELVRFQFSSDHLPPAKMAQYSTQLHYLVAFPASIFVLLLFALTMGMTTDRRTGAAAGVFNAIFLLLAFVFVMEFFLALGRGNRLNPFLAAWLGPVIFAGLALTLMGRKYGWFWHLERRTHAWAEQRWPEFFAARSKDDRLPQDQMNLRLQSLQLLLNRVTKKNPDYPGDMSGKTDAAVTPPAEPETKPKPTPEAAAASAPSAAPEKVTLKLKPDVSASDPPSVDVSATPQSDAGTPPALPQREQVDHDTPPPLPEPETNPAPTTEDDAPPPLPSKTTAPTDAQAGETPPPLPPKAN